MALSFEFFSGNGALTQFTVPFPWIFNGHLYVTVNGAQKFEPADWTVAGSLMTFAVAPPSGTDNVYVARQTPDTNRLIDFVNGGGINESVMDKDSNQIFYLEQEMIDRSPPLITSGVDDGKFLRTTTLGALQWYELLDGAQTWTGDQRYEGVNTFIGRPISAAGMQFNSGGNVDLGPTVKFDVNDPDGLRVGGANIFSRANTWTGTQWFQGACTFAGTHVFDPSAVLNINNAAGLQIAGINIFNRSNTWANTNVFSGTVSLGHTTVPTSKTFNVVDSGGLRVGGTSIFARLNTWSADQDFDGLLKIGGTDIFARTNTWTGTNTFESTTNLNGPTTTASTLTALNGINVTGAGYLIGGISLFARDAVWTGSHIFNHALGVETRWTNDTGGNAGPETRLNRFTTTAPTAGDKGAFFSWYHTVSTLAQSLIGNIMMVIDDVTSTSVDSHFEFYTKINNGNAIRLKVGPGVAAGSSQAIPAEGWVNAIGYEKLGTALPVQEEYVSSLQTITSAGQLILAHGLASTPRVIQATLECIDAGGDLSYVDGDRVEVPIEGAVGGGSGDRMNAVEVDATNITIRFSSLSSYAYSYCRKDTGGVQAMTNTKWQLEVRAYA